MLKLDKEKGKGGAEAGGGSEKSDDWAQPAALSAKHAGKRFPFRGAHPGWTESLLNGYQVSRFKIEARGIGWTDQGVKIPRANQ